jgi:hypothetical protein
MKAATHLPEANMTTTKTSSKKASTKKAKPEATEKKMSALAAAAKVLEQKGTAMTCQELIGVMAAKGYWSSPGGKTPAATLYAAIQREIATKGADSRFKKTAPGRFAAKDSPITPAASADATPVKKPKGRKTGKNATAVAPDEAPETAA